MMIFFLIGEQVLPVEAPTTFEFTVSWIRMFCRARLLFAWRTRFQEAYLYDIFQEAYMIYSLLVNPILDTPRSMHSERGTSA